ncbi:hypothetical protein F2P81_008096 [Scophthalmus maximus]|uniref:Uncharacterized protein n=1 Tax=Scophthalmus maximus TaxID=52904 RepID=A0A6A4TA53_SCOMX|nr:hypothetical protein F2P81_008096 [Scophthalmus maximus]
MNQHRHISEESILLARLHSEREVKKLDTFIQPPQLAPCWTAIGAKNTRGASIGEKYDLEILPPKFL